MNIGFDLDNIFIDTPPFFSKDLIERIYKKRDNGILEYRIPSLPEQIVRKLSHLPLLRPAIKENLAFINTLSKEKNNLFLISSRFKFLESETDKLISRYNFNQIFDKMYFNFENKQPHIFKDEVFQKLNLDLYVDDDLSLLKYLAAKHPKTKFFLLHPWGKKKSVGNNITPISKLSELLEK